MTERETLPDSWIQFENRTRYIASIAVLLKQMMSEFCATQSSNKRYISPIIDVLKNMCNLSVVIFFIERLCGKINFSVSCIPDINRIEASCMRV